MGSGASNLTKEQKAILSKELQSAFEKCTADNLEEDIVQSTLISEYKRVIKTFQKVEKVEPAVTSSPPAAKELSSLSSKFSSKNKNVEKPVKFTRRRSFDASRNSKRNLLSASKDEVETALTKASVSEAVIKPAEETIDSWDSVTQQPFCDTCQMAFKSLAFLDRHVKYSDLHMKNVDRKNKKDEKVPEVQKMPSLDEEPPVPATMSAKIEAQVEGTHFKLLYTGSKFFWRTQKNIDIDIYLHVLPHVIEVISFDPVKHKEATRIYLNYVIIQDTLELLVARDYEEKIKELTQDRFFSLDDEAALRDKLLVQRVITYILQRLQLDSSGTHGEVLYVALSGDADLKSALMTSAPASLVPVSLTRRRRTSTEEIEATINSIKIERALIGEHLEQAHHFTKSPTKPKVGAPTSVATAERISAAVYSAVQFLTGKKWYHNVSLPKQRFIKAARRVIRQLLVVQTKAVLAARASAMSPSTASVKMTRKASVRAREV